MAKTKEQLKAEATEEVEAAKPIKKSVDGVVSEFSDDDYAQKITDITNSKWDKQQYGYIQDRQLAYPTVGDQLDMQYWDSVNGTTTWKDAIAKVKSDNPKPS
tara:strand:- start:632 stop:937 length:306 start_codon:yes stop_codon:yes gene_type:complete